MKKILFFLFLLPFTGSLSAQINFGYQASGLNTAFYITQTSQFYEGIRWVFGDGSEQWAGSDTIHHTYSSSGTYQVCVYGYPMPPGPIDSICKTLVLQSIGIEEHSEDYLFSLNETSRQLTIQTRLINPAATNAVLTIFDKYGKKVLEKPIRNNPEIIDLQSFKSGNYFINLKFLNKTITKKITLI